MSISTDNITVRAELALPNFRGEHIFIKAERNYVARKLKAMSSEPLVAAAIGKWIDRTPRYKDWVRYDHALVHYESQLIRHESEISAGLVPIKIVIGNRGDSSLRGIRIKIEVTGGDIHRAKKCPERPKRIDGSESTDWWKLLASGGFWRSGVRVTSHMMEAKFSRLGSLEAAYLIIKPTYIKSDSNTHLRYSLIAHGLKTTLQGEVMIME